MENKSDVSKFVYLNNRMRFNRCMGENITCCLL